MMNNNNNAQQTFNGYGIGGGGGMMGGGNGVDDGLNFKCFGGDVNGNAMMNANNGACQMMMMGGGGGADGFNGGGSGGIMNGGGGSGGSSRGSEFYSAPFMGNKEINNGRRLVIHRTPKNSFTSNSTLLAMIGQILSRKKYNLNLI